MFVQPKKTLLDNEPGNYALHHELANCNAGIGTVYMALHKPSGQQVAVKRLRLERTRLDNHIVTDEILTMRQFCHPNVLPCLAAFVSNATGEVMVVMPLQCFRSCRQMLDDHYATGMPERLVALVMRDALTGLEYLHRRGIVHRSLRASHILVGRNRAVVCGFRDCASLVANGERLRRLHELPGLETATAASGGDGTSSLNWVAPEVLEQNVIGYTDKADVYSAGITTCELANSLKPFADMPKTLMLTEKIRGNTPALLDGSTFMLPKDADSGVSDSLAETHQIYGNRTLSDNFHKFAEICMHRFPVERPTVAQLLLHVFLKQAKQTTLTAELNVGGAAAMLDCTVRPPSTATWAQNAAAELARGVADMIVQNQVDWDLN